MSKNLGYQANHNKTTLGQFGFKKINVGESYSGSFAAIQALEDSSLIADTESVEGDLQFNDNIVTGLIIYGNFNNISVTSGKVLIYLL